MIESGDAPQGLLHVLNQGHPLWRFSDSGVHQKCFERWEHRAYFEAIHAKWQAMQLTKRLTGEVWRDLTPPEREDALKDADAWGRRAQLEMRSFVAALDVEHFGILARAGGLWIRLMRDDETDYALMSAWLSDPRVLEFFDGRDNPLSIRDARQKYSPRIMGEENTTPCIIENDGDAIGYVQFYPKDVQDVWGLDQFIGIPDKWSQGLGTRIVRLMLDYLFTNKHASRCVLDPQVLNLRAIRCYEKAGFQKARLLRRHELHEGELRDCWLMEAIRPQEADT